MNDALLAQLYEEKRVRDIILERMTVEGSEARATCHGIAYHFRPVRSGRNTRTFVGTYEIHLRRSGDAWRIDAFRFDLGFLEGNADLHAEDPT